MLLPDVLPSSARLVLRRFRREDLPGMVAYRSDPEVARHQSWTPEWSMVDAEAFFRRDQPTKLGTHDAWVQIALEARASGELVGDLALHCLAEQPDTVEFGVTLARAHQRQGLATEALRALVGWLFQHGAHRVFARADARNDAVRKLLSRLGMRQEAEHREADWFKGEWSTLCVYAMLASEWVGGSREGRT